jgi:hypothetical protein
LDRRLGPSTANLDGEAGEGGQTVTTAPRSSTYALHAQWARLENEHHQLAAAIEEALRRGADVTPMRTRQAQLLLEINSIVADIRDAPASTLEDYLALLDVAIEHEIDLAADMAYYGPQDYPLIMRLLRGLAEQAPGFEFNSLRRWLSLPGQLEPMKGKAAPPGSAARRNTPLKVVDDDQPQGPRTVSTCLSERPKRAKMSRDC